MFTFFCVTLKTHERALSVFRLHRLIISCSNDHAYLLFLCTDELQRHSILTILGTEKHAPKFLHKKGGVFFKEAHQLVHHLLQLQPRRHWWEPRPQIHSTLRASSSRSMAISKRLYSLQVSWRWSDKPPQTRLMQAGNFWEMLWTHKLSFRNYWKAGSACHEQETWKRVKWINNIPLMQTSLT